MFFARSLSHRVAPRAAGLARRASLSTVGTSSSASCPVASFARAPALLAGTVTALTLGLATGVSVGDGNASHCHMHAESYREKELHRRLGALEDRLQYRLRYSGFKNVTVVDSPAVRLLFTKIRDRETGNEDYVRYADRLMTLLAEEGLALVHGVKGVVVQTPCGPYHGLQEVEPSKMCVVSIPRSGDILMEAVRRVSHGISVGKILCQRDEEDPEKKATLFYSKLPRDIKKKNVVILVDPMLATGGSASLAIEKLVEAGVDPKRIVFLNVVSCPEGLQHLEEKWPDVKVITAAVDRELNDEKFIVPGLGDFGDRYYKTE